MSSARASFRFAVAAAVVLVVLMGSTRAGHDPSAGDVSAAQQDAQTPTFRTEANYVRVDVYPTAKGAPVMDLRQEDFEVLEDGVAQRVDAFEHIMIRVPEPLRTSGSTTCSGAARRASPRDRSGHLSDFGAPTDSRRLLVGGAGELGPRRRLRALATKFSTVG